MNLFKKIIKIAGIILATVFLLVLLVLVYFNFPVKSRIDKAEIGVTFSHLYSKNIGLDWKENFAAILDDLGIRKIRIPVYWNLVEKEEGVYDFSDIDWQLDEAGKRDAEVILVIGQKVPRWPECYVPDWAEGDNEKRKEKLISFLNVVVDRYKDDSTVKYWQVENEPTLNFGICPQIDVELLDREIAFVREKDGARDIMLTDSGELSLWVPVARRADVFGTTMYRNVYKEGWGYYKYPVGPRFFRFKKWMIKAFAGQYNAVVIELQGEPWIAGWLVDQPLEEQFKSLNKEKLSENVEYAKKSDFSEIYIWGAEWWYWLKVTQNDPSLWEEARKILKENAN